jgi:sugar-specific transcriptional regulator TrmB
MDQIKNFLKEIGLSDTESSIYLCVLENGAMNVSDIVKSTQIQRTTVYHALDTLIQKGLAAKSMKQGKLTFSVISPEQLKVYLENKIQTLESKKKELNNLLPKLLTASEIKPGKVQVSHFEGIEGIKTAVDIALYCRTAHWDIIAPKKNFFSEFDPQYQKYYIEQRKRNNVISRSLWETNHGKRVLTPQEIIERHPRVLPPVMHGQFDSVIIIFDDKVAFISSIQELSAVIIQSAEISKTMRAMFEGLWAVSTEYKI